MRYILEQLLKVRNARLLLVQKNGKSFHGQVLRPEMDFIAFGQNLYLSLELKGTMLCIIIDDNVTRKRLAESKINLTDSVEKFSLTVDDLELVIELDDSPS
jgi:hypothetical protein